jgi:metallo-beta-lactamase family protein
VATANLELTFLGAAGTVTGSRFLLTAATGRVLVDCGMFQGPRAIRRRNWEPFPIPPDSIDAVIVTHAHLDHCGYLPALVKQGFSGPIYSSHNSTRLIPIILRDSAKLQEEDTAYARRSGYSRHAEPEPLYDAADARAAIDMLVGRDFGESWEVIPDLSARLDPAGHILGSATVSLTYSGARSPDSSDDARIVFSGDLGRGNHPLLKGPRLPQDADLVVMESTYGNREHEDVDAELEQMAAAITQTIERGGTVVVPAFAVDRTEVLLTAIRALMDQHRIPRVPVYVDSPMALAAFDVYRDAIAHQDPEITTAALAEGVDAIDIPDLHQARTPDDSKALDAPGPKIIVSASGMGSGGRVTHHLKYFLPDARNCVLLVGYQAFGTTGQQLRDGARSVRIHGQDVPVLANVVDIEAFSVHADRSELLDWIGSPHHRPGAAFLVHGEEEAAADLAATIRRELGIPAVVAEHGQTIEVSAREVPG